MIVQVERVTPGLVSWLRTAHDDGQPALSVRWAPRGLRVEHRRGGELSAAEQLEVRAIVAAHEAEALCGI